MLTPAHEVGNLPENPSRATLQRGVSPLLGLRRHVTSQCRVIYPSQRCQFRFVARLPQSEGKGNFCLARLIYPTRAAATVELGVQTWVMDNEQRTTPMADPATNRFFKCPTSGQMLGALVSAFRLHLPSVGGGTSEFLGSGNAGKQARNYFQGKWVPEQTRHDICSWVVQALVHSDLLPAVELPAAPSRENPDLEQTLRMGLFTWLQVWDAAYVTAAQRWHAADGALAGFILGRQVVIDLALRWGALCHLCKITDCDSIWFEDGRSSKGKSIIEAAMKRAGKTMTRDEFARAFDGVRGTIKQRTDRTVDRWYDELVIPDDENLACITELLADNDQVLQRDVLRFLRLRYGGLRLAMSVRDAMGPRLANRLVDGLMQFVRSSIDFSKSARASADVPLAPDDLLGIAQIRLLMLGSGEPLCRGPINAWLARERGPVWHDDLQFAGNGAADARIAACFKVIGDWPALEAAAQRAGLHGNGSSDEQRQVAELAAIMAMNDNRVPPGFNEWLAANPDKVQRIAGGDDSMKAVIQAEQATAASNEGDHERALPHWARAVSLERDPRRKANYLFHYGVSLWQARSRRHDDAIEALTESFRLWPIDHPQRDRPFVEIAIVYQNRGWFDHALQHLETDPVNFTKASAHFNYVKGRTLHALHRYDEALVCFETAIDLKTGSLADAHAFASDCAYELARSAHDPSLLKKGRHHAKEALHLGKPWAHDKWAVG